MGQIHMKYLLNAQAKRRLKNLINAAFLSALVSPNYLSVEAGATDVSANSNKDRNRSSNAKGRITSRVLTRTINFPNNYSLGTVYFIPPKPEKLVVWTQDAISTQKAQGNIKVPASPNGGVLLVGGYHLAQNMKVLQKLKANDLQYLDMYRTEIEDKDIVNIVGLTGLIGLQLDDTEIGDASLKTICRLPNLKFVTLSSTQVTGATLADLAPLKNLRRLELGHNILKKEYLSELLKLKQVQKIGLQGCRINDKDLETIGKLDNLETLQLLENTQITDLGLKKLAGLKRLGVLEVTHAQITINGLKALKHLPLHLLIIGKGQFTPSQIARIKQVFPKAQINIHDSSNRMDPELFKPLH